MNCNGIKLSKMEQQLQNMGVKTVKTRFEDCVIKNMFSI